MRQARLVAVPVNQPGCSNQASLLKRMTGTVVCGTERGRRVCSAIYPVLCSMLAIYHSTNEEQP